MATLPLLHVPRGARLWPAELDPIEGPPHELWLRGRVELLAPLPRVAIVGSRTPTPYGTAQARRFAAALADAGVTVVSGLARGIDETAHAGALDVGGATIAVLGSGVDRPWPEGPLAERVAREGLLLSEHPPGQPPRRSHFPLRNRLIAGLAQAVLVVEAAHASGSLITARWAVDQGRSVHALPGRVDHPMARGCHRLIREGAGLVEDPAEILAELGQAGAPSRPAPPPLQGDAARIEEALRGETSSADELCRALGLPVEAVLSGLVALELADRVVRAPGGLYRLAQRGA